VSYCLFLCGAMADEEKLAAVVACLMNDGGVIPIGDRMRSVFLLKQDGGETAMDAMIAGLYSPSILLAHECAYCLGQLRKTYPIDALTKALRDDSLNPIVRHEAAEAMAAIGDPRVLAVLEEYSTSKVVEVAETCVIAVAKLKQQQEEKKKKRENDATHNFNSVDPAPPSDSVDVGELTTTMCDEDVELFVRYRAMFALRNLNTEESVLGLVAGLQGSSALFRHEICYVLGQMAHVASFSALEAVLKRDDEHPMVRHEAAEAIGNIDDVRVPAALAAFLKSGDRIVKESCQVGLDIYNYNSSEQFDSIVTEVGPAGSE
jgi:deoxyhypusine monooxygenase